MCCWHVCLCALSSFACKFLICACVLMWLCSNGDTGTLGTTLTWPNTRPHMTPVTVWHERWNTEDMNINWEQKQPTSACCSNGFLQAFCLYSLQGLCYRCVSSSKKWPVWTLTIFIERSEWWKRNQGPCVGIYKKKHIYICFPLGKDPMRRHFDASALAAVHFCVQSVSPLASSCFPFSSFSFFSYNFFSQIYVDRVELELE